MVVPDLEADYAGDTKRVRFGGMIGVKAITIGAMERCYGGFEEGGWWYDRFYPTRVFFVTAKRHERWLKRLRQLTQQYNERYNPRGLGSVLGGEDVVVIDGAQFAPDPMRYYS